MAFVKATKQRARLRMGLTGPSGSGKTWTALAVAQALAGPDGRVAVLDTEHGSATKYAGQFLFDTDPDFAAPWHPNKFIDGIKAAADAGYDVLVIDSLSHAWAGQGGLLDEVEKIKSRQKTQNAFTAWRDATPIQQRLIEAILAAPMHVIVTMRSKTEWVLDEDSSGGSRKTKPRKVGLAPVQRDDVEYEFDLMLDLDHNHSGVVSKTRCPGLDGQVIDRPGAELASTLAAWLSDGEEPAPPPSATEEQLSTLKAFAADARLPDSGREWVQAKIDGGLLASDAATLIASLEKRVVSGC